MRRAAGLTAIGVVAISGLLLGSGVHSRLLDGKTPQPVWRTDLTQNPLYAAGIKQSEQPVGIQEFRPQLAFVNTGSLAVSFGGHLDRSGPLSGKRSGDYFFAIFINARNGTFRDRILSWPSSVGSKLMPVRRDGFAVLADRHLWSYSEDLQLRAKTPLPHTDTNGQELGSYPTSQLIWQKEHWFAVEDPSQAYLVLSHGAETTTPFYWIDGTNLKVLSSIVYPKRWWNPFSASSQDIILDSSPELLVGKRDGAWQPFCGEYKNAAAAFVNNDEIFVGYNNGGGVRYALVNRSCEKLVDLPGRSTGTVVARAASGNRFVISEAALENTPLETVFTVKIHVWNVSPAKELFQLSLASNSENEANASSPPFAAALSPDGSLLAVLFGSSLVLYDVNKTNQ